MHERELAIALQAADRASQHLVREYAQFQAIPDAPANITTEADRQSQELILQTIRAAFPDDALCAEETTGSLQGIASTGERLWIVDPIDGTRGFAQKNGEVSIMIGFVERGEIRVGVVQQPATGRLTYAVQGTGCWRRDATDAAPVRCRVSDARQLHEATLTQSHSRTPGKRSRWLDLLKPARVLESYSAGIKLALVARGEADLYLNSYDAFHDWDICAGHILVTEAGGQVTGIQGQELHYGREGAWQRLALLATNGTLHADAVARIGSTDTPCSSLR